MKHTVTPLLFVLLFTLVTACQQGRPVSGNSAPPPTVNQNNVTNAAAASQTDEQTRPALLEALADERRAFARYEAVLAKFGDVMPFSNIVNAEKRHESFLLPLLEKYKLPVPKNEFTKESVTAPETVIDACKEGIEGEKQNIAMYDRLLGVVMESDIRDTFTYLRNASKNNHLPAFERCAQGRGQGRRNRGVR